MTHVNSEMFGGCGGSAWGCAKLSGMHIGVLGGTGPAGRGIATRLAATGHRVTLGSRDRERAARGRGRAARALG